MAEQRALLTHSQAHPPPNLFNDAPTDSTSCGCFLLLLIFFPCLTLERPQDYIIYCVLNPYFLVPPEPNLNFKFHLIEGGWCLVPLRKKIKTIKYISKRFIFQMKWAPPGNSGIQQTPKNKTGRHIFNLSTIIYSVLVTFSDYYLLYATTAM